jgi:DNA polymerase-3 subunit delta'
MSVTPSIIGHQKAITGLRRAIERETLHHAYLFEGPKGLGKGTVALYLAMTLNCESEDTPCGTCDPCRHIAAETHPDIIHLRPNAERASRTISVEAVREVVRQTGYHHYSAKHRVVIIDPAEAMPASAANALLKTLEEPPAGTTFVLIATHARALLPTIVSRCQRMRFSPLDNRDLSTWLQQLGVENPLPYVRRSEGCPGRALSLLDGGLEARNETRDTLLGLL